MKIFCLYCLRNVDAYFYRTATGVEIDLLLNFADELIAIENEQPRSRATRYLVPVPATVTLAGLRAIVDNFHLALDS